MFKILLATDGSVFAVKAAEFTRELCTQIPDSEVTVLHVVDTGLLAVTFGPATGLGVPSSIILPHEVEAFSSMVLEEARDVVKEHAKKVTTRLEQGHPAEVICKVAEEGRYSMVVMGNRGMGRITGILLGSVTYKVLHKSKVPVLIVPREQ